MNKVSLKIYLLLFLLLTTMGWGQNYIPPRVQELLDEMQEKSYEKFKNIEVISVLVCGGRSPIKTT